MLFFKNKTSKKNTNNVDSEIKNKEIELYEKKSNKTKKKKKKTNDFKFMDDIIGIKDIHEKYIETTNEFSVIVSLSTLDYEILNNDEQTAFEDSLISLMMSLNFPIKFKTTTKKFNLTDFKNLLNSTKLTEETQIQYREKLIKKAEEIEQSKDIYIRQNYLVISALKINNDKERTLRELNSRFQTVMNALLSANIKAKVITKLEAYQLFYDIFNKYSNLQILDTLENGSYDLYSQGVGILYKPDDINEQIDKNLLEIGTKEEEMLKDEDIFINGTVSIKSMIKPDIFDVQDDYIKLGRNRYCRIYTFENLPRFLNVGYLNELLTLGMVDITTYIENIPDGLVIKTITQKYSKIKSQVDLKQSKGAIVDYDQLLAAQDLDKLRELIQTNSDRMFYIQNLITLWAETKDELDYKSNLLEDICARKGIKSRVLVKDQKAGFISTLPLGRNTYKENLRNITTGAAVSFFPIGNTELCHKYGIYFGKNLITNSPISYDQFLGQRNLANSNELTNPHMFICGKAGSGKSVTEKVTTARKRSAGHWIIILDPEKEYEKLCKKLGGKYITIKVGQKSGINPFEVEIEEDERGRKYVDLYAKMAEIRSMLNSFAVIYRGKQLEGTELTSFERAFHKLFTDRGINRDPNSLYEDNPYGVGKIKKKLPTLSDLKNELAKDEYTKDFAELMNLITGEGSMALFDCETDPKMNIENNPLIGINLKELDEFTQHFAMKSILTWIWGTFSNYKYKNYDKDVVVDEGWIFAKMREGEYLEHIARRGRKYKISLTIATQMIEEFLNNPSGEAIIKQCATKFIMKQDPSVAGQIVEFFHLSNSAKTLITGFDKGQGLLITEREQVLMQIELFDFEKDFALT